MLAVRHATRVVPQAQLMPEALKLARAIAAHSMPVAAKAKDCIKRAMEVPLSEGIRYEQCATPLTPLSALG